MSVLQLSLVFSVTVVIASACLNNWSVVPLDGTMTPLNCDIVSSPATITSTCTITASTNRSVHWYYSKERHFAGWNGTRADTLQGIATSSKCISMSLPICNAELMVTNVQPIHEGYYWCEVDTQAQLFRRPSSVLRISGCSIFGSCTNKVYRTNINRTLECAVSATATDISSGLEYVNLYTDNNCVPEPSPTKIIDTSEEDKSSTSTEIMMPTTTNKETMLEFSISTMSPAISTSTSTASTVKTDGSIGSSSSTSSSSNVISGGDGTSTDTSNGDGAASLPLGIIWPVIGGVVGLLLFVVAILLLLILIVQCRKRRGKGEITPNNLVNQGYVTDEADLTSSTMPMIQRFQDTSQLYDEIPSNFTLTASSSEHSPNTRTAHGTLPSPTRPPLQDQYEDIDIKPSPSNPQTNQAARRHQYESVTNEEDDDDYNRLVRSESSSRAHNLSTSYSQNSVSPVQMSSENESAVFDNPNYSQVKHIAPKKHVDIYRLESLDSSSGLGGQAARQQKVPKMPLESHSESSGEDFSDPSKFAVTGLAKDETKRVVAATEALPPGQYTKVLPGNEDTDYAHRIVSTDEQYISEQGHVYQVLEKDDSPGGQHASEDHFKGVSSAEDQFGSSNQRHIYHILENPVSENGMTDDQKDNCCSYSRLSRQNGSFHSPESSRRHTDARGTLLEENDQSDPDYDVIDSGSEGTTTTPTRTERPEYNVIERPGTQRSSVSQQDQHYDVTERDHKPLLHERSTTSVQVRPGAYDVIERNTTPSVPSACKVMPSAVELSPPPNYSSLELSNSEKGDKKFRIDATSPFYEVLHLENSTEGRRNGNIDSTYNTLDTTVGSLTMSDGIDNAIYHAVS